MIHSRHSSTSETTKSGAWTFAFKRKPTDDRMKGTSPQSGYKILSSLIP